MQTKANTLLNIIGYNSSISYVIKCLSTWLVKSIQELFYDSELIISLEKGGPLLKNEIYLQVFLAMFWSIIGKTNE